MTLFQKTIRNWMIFSSLLLFIAMLAYSYEQKRIKVLDDTLGKLEQSEKKINKLQQEVEQYEQLLAKVGSDRIRVQGEPVNVNANFTQEQILQLSRELATTYEGDGLFQLTSFLLEQSNEEINGMPLLKVELSGKKVFIFNE